jgi:hypothetical protein
MADADLDRIINDLRARREQLSRLLHDATDKAVSVFKRESDEDEDKDNDITSPSPREQRED